MIKNKRAFTLMELLVVLVIISTLVSAAVPYYTKTIWLARARNLQILVDRIGKAHQIYYDNNYVCAPSLEELDIDIEGALPETGSESTRELGGNGASSEKARKNEYFSVYTVNAGGADCYTIGQFRKGPWQNIGFMFVHNANWNSAYKDYKKQMLCWDTRSSDLCQKLLSVNTPTSENAYNRLYKM